MKREELIKELSRKARVMSSNSFEDTESIVKMIVDETP